MHKGHGGGALCALKGLRELVRLRVGFLRGLWGGARRMAFYPRVYHQRVLVLSWLTYPSARIGLETGGMGRQIVIKRLWSEMSRGGRVKHVPWYPITSESPLATMIRMMVIKKMEMKEGEHGRRLLLDTLERQWPIRFLSVRCSLKESLNMDLLK